MAQESKKFNFSKDAGGIRDMLKDVIDFLDRNFFSNMRIICGAHNTIAPFANHLLYSVPAPLAIFCEKVYIHG
jgi:hypothetical protein